MESPAYPPLPPISSQYRARLRAQLVASFSASEFKLLCADIGVNYDTVPGDEIESRAQGLVARLARRGNLTQLVDYCARMRPHLNWLEQAEEHAQADNLSSWDDIETPAPPKPDHPPVNSAFIGRELELTHYKTQLAELHIAIICGFAGVGKTALAVALAQRVSPAEKVFWHSFHADEGVDVILWRMAGFLGWQGQVELWRMMNSARQSSNSAQPSSVAGLLDTQLEWAWFFAVPRRLS